MKKIKQNSPRKDSKIIIILVIIIAILVSYNVGYRAGYVAGLDWAVEKSVYFLELKGVELDVNEKVIAIGLAYYQRRLDKLFPTNFTNEESN